MNDHNAIPSVCSTALKEWAIICEAIRAGKQQLLFRTGGIEETGNGFQPKSEHFWLFPTRFHQSAELVTPEFAKSVELNDPVDAARWSEGTVRIECFCQVLGVHYVASRRQLDRLREWHVLCDDVLTQRFEYRNPGIFVLVVEAFELEQPSLLENLQHYDGCKSWVELEMELETAGLQRIVDAAKSRECQQRVAEAIAGGM